MGGSAGGLQQWGGTVDCDCKGPGPYCQCSGRGCDHYCTVHDLYHCPYIHEHVYGKVFSDDTRFGTAAEQICICEPNDVDPTCTKHGIPIPAVDWRDDNRRRKISALHRLLFEGTNGQR